MKMKLIHIGFRVGYFLETVCQNEQTYTLRKHLKRRKCLAYVRIFLSVIAGQPTLFYRSQRSAQQVSNSTNGRLYTETNFKKLGTEILSGGFYFFIGLNRTRSKGSTCPDLSEQLKNNTNGAPKDAYSNADVLVTFCNVHFS